ncbi:hypothetical protein [Streptomyces sp. NPDC059788]|uniref:hypothetical protein n=1 Tax=Streptomyces sp. NPDC059788 TaxID=3346948 RepID=UPI0036633D2F
MPTSTMRPRRRLAAALLLAGAAISLTACGQRPVAAGAPSPAPSPSSVVPSGGAPPYVEPGSRDGAPHYNENNAGRRARDMSPASEKDAQKEAGRIEPVLKSLWKQGKWGPENVRSAMLALGYQERKAASDGDRRGPEIEVRAMDSRFVTDHYVTPEGARIGLRVHKDACVTAFVQKTNYQVSVNGPYPETGCFEPPFAH